MPLPWRKARGAARVSRLFADLQTLPLRRRDSMVVETGFPTSLIDLLVKNQDRFKKQPSRNPKKQPRSAPCGSSSASSEEVAAASGDSASAVAPRISQGGGVSDFGDESEARFEAGEVKFEAGEAKFVAVGGKLEMGVANFEAGEGKFEVGKANPEVGKANFEVVEANLEVGGDKLEERDDGGPSAIAAAAACEAFLTVLKVLVVVALAFATKQLALGITMSASLLLLLELVGKHSSFLLRPRLAACRRLASFIQKVFILTRGKPQKERVCLVVHKVEGNEETFASTSYGLSVSFESNADDSIEEILESSPKFVAHVDEIQVAEVPDFDLPNPGKTQDSTEMDCQQIVVVEKDEDLCEVPGLQIRQTRRGKLKAKMIKRFVPKRLRSSKKGVMVQDGVQEMGNQWRPYVVEYTKVECRGGEQKEFVQDASLSISSAPDEVGKRREDEEEDDIDISNPSVGKVSQANAENALDSKEVERLARGGSGYWILLLVILSGLLGGRILALVLAMTGCLVLKSADIVWRFKNVGSVGPPIQSSSQTIG